MRFDRLNVVRRVVAALMFMSYSVLRCPGAPEVARHEGHEEDCKTRASRAAFVLNSNSLSYFAAEKRDVFETLACIATHGEDVGERNGAFRALVELVVEPAQLQGYLLAILRTGELAIDVREITCRVLAYVADEEGRNVLRRAVVSGLPGSLKSPECKALVEVGDEELRQSLIHAPVAMDRTDPAAHAAELAIKKIEIQTDVEKLLDELERGDSELQGSWLLRQAIRKGATQERIRQVAMPHVRRMSDKPSGGDDYSLIAEMDRAGVLNRADLDAAPRIRWIVERQQQRVDEGVFPPWARRVEKLRDEFYGVTRIRVDGKAMVLPKDDK